MDIRESLLQEHSKRQAQLIADWVGQDVDRFAELIHLMLGDEDKISQRAAWAASHTLDRHPHLIRPHLEAMVHTLRNTEQHHAVRRNILRSLQSVVLPESLWGEVADCCFQFLADPREPAAIRVFAMSVLQHICEQVPELKPELKLIIEDQWPHASAGFRSRGRKVLQWIERGS